jgi:hypothetical protein
MSMRTQFNSYILPRTAELIRLEVERTGIPAGKLLDKAIAIYSMEDFSLFHKRLQEYLMDEEQVDLEAISRLKNFLDAYLRVSMPVDALDKQQ